MYRTDITQSIEPAAPNYNTLAKVSEAAATGARIQAQGAEMLSNIGASIFQVGYKEYKTQQTKATVGGLEEGLKSEVATLENQMTEVERLDTENKAKVELERIQAVNQAQEIVPAAILSGSDPEEAKNLSQSFFTTQENKFVATFREEQKRIIAARDAMPQRQHEMMLRSEALLKKYITSMPELASNFRQVAQQITGKERLDLYSVNKLYEDINFIEKQKQEQGKAIEKQNEVLRGAYINDRKKAGTSETQANLEFQMLQPNERLQLANTATEYANANTQSEAALKAGGNALLNITTLTQAMFDNDLIASNSHIYARMQQLGVSRQMIASGNIPAEIASSTAYKKLQEEAGTSILSLLDEQYQSANNKLIDKIKTSPADAATASKAQNDLAKWYEDKRKFYTENKTSFLVATSMAPEDFNKTLKQRLDIVNSLVTSLQLPPEIIASLGMTGDKQAYNDARTRYPKSAKALDHFARLREKAMQGVPDTEWMDLMKNIDSFNGVDTSKTPTNLNEAVASIVTFNQAADTVKKAAIDKTLMNANTGQTVAVLVAKSFADPANAEQFLSTNVQTTQQVLAQLDAGEKPAIINQIDMAAETHVYGADAHGDKAKMAYADTLNYYSRFADMGVSVVFADPTGNGTIAIKYTNPKPGASPDKIRNWTLTRDSAIMAKTNARLKAVDDALRIQSLTTGKPINQLRFEFINTFNKAGMVSEARSEQTIKMLAPQESPTRGTIDATSNTTEKWWR